MKKYLYIVAVVLGGSHGFAQTADTVALYDDIGTYGVCREGADVLKTIGGQGAAGICRDDAHNTVVSIGFFGSPVLMPWLAQMAPDVPVGLSVDSTTDNTVNFSWTGNTEADLDFYIIYRSTTAGFEPDRTDSVGTAVRTAVFYTDQNGLTDGTVYYYRISAVNDKGFESDPSDQVSAVPGEGPAASGISVAPNPTREEAIATLEADISDQTSGGSNVGGGEYCIDVLRTAGNGTPITAAKDGALDSPDETIVIGVNVLSLGLGLHTVYVRGKDANGNWGAADSADFIVSMNPPVLTGINPVSGFDIDTINATIEGNGFIDGAAFYLERSGGTTRRARSVTVEDSATATARFDLTGMATGWWALIIENPDFERDTLDSAFVVNPAPVVNNMTPDEGTTIDVLVGVSVTGANLKNSSAKLIMSGETDIGAADVTMVSKVQLMCTFNMVGAATGDWDLVVTNYDGQEDTLYAAINILLPLPVIDSLQPYNGDDDNIAVLSVYGDHFYSGLSTMLRHADGDSVVGTGITIIDSARFTVGFNITGVSTGAWDLVVTNAGGNSDTLYSGFTVNNKMPPADPSGLSALARSGEVSLGWDENAEGDLAYYVVYRDTTDRIGSADSVATVVKPKVTFTDSSVTNDVTYYYWVTAVDSAGNASGFSDSVAATPSIPSIYNDSLVLAEFYDSTGGAAWTDDSNWLTGDVGSWFGVGVGGGRVVSLDLTANNLSGRIIPALAGLDSLRELRLPGNALTGGIPTNIGNLKVLEVLDLSGNGLTGAIPTGITELAMLETLAVRANGLSGNLPADFSGMASLRTFIADSNGITGSIPAGIGALDVVTDLNLAANALSGTIPAGMGGMAALVNLNLADNGLTGTVPDSFAYLSGLTVLDLSNNDLSGLPDFSGGSLASLAVEGNRLTFEDIEPQVGVALFTYSPQDSIGTAGDTIIQGGTDLVLDINTGGSDNRYLWRMDGTPLGSAGSSSSYTMDSTLVANSGSYTCDITNATATALTIYNRALQVTVDNAPGKPAGLTITRGHQQAGLSWGQSSAADFGRYYIYWDMHPGAVTLRDSTSYGDAGQNSKTITGLTTDTVYYFRVTAVDTHGFASPYSNEKSEHIGNYAPVIVESPESLDADILEDETYSATVSATDENTGDTATYYLIAPSPAGMSIDSVSGAISWTPSDSDTGNNTVTVVARDPQGLEDTVAFTVHVTNVNDPPQVTSAASDSATEDELFIYAAAATDPDNVPVISFENLPGWLSASGGDSLRGTPREGATDTSFTVIASDGQAADTLSVTLAVGAVNDPPVITSAAVGLARAMVEYTYIGTAEDPDDTPTVTIVEYPSWMTSYGNMVRGTPALSTADTCLTVIATDGEYSDTLQVTLTIQDTNVAPYFTSAGRDTAYEDTEFGYVMTAYDADGSPLSFTCKALPGWLAMTDSVTLGGTPPEGSGDTVVTMYVYDGEFYDTLALALAVMPVNDPPVIVSATADTATEDSMYQYILQAVDPDDTPTIALVYKPSWLTLFGTGILRGTPQEGVGDTSFSFIAYDGQLGDTIVVQLKVIAVNDPPVITSAARDTTEAAKPYEYIAAVDDPDDVPSVAYENVPAWLTVAGDTLRGTPDSSANNGDTSFTVIAADGEYSDTVTVLLHVKPNAGDTLRIISAGYDTTIEDTFYQYVAAADGPNKPIAITYFPTGFPSWLTIAGDTVRGTPPMGTRNESFQIIANDGSTVKFKTVYLTVKAINFPPHITSSTSNVYAYEQVLFEYTVTVEDSNAEDVITAEFYDLPATWTGTAAAGMTFSGYPPGGSGYTSTSFKVRVTDGTAWDSVTVPVIILPAQNFAPEVTSAALDTAREQVPYTYAVTYLDANANDSVSIGFGTLPAWLTADDDTTLSGTPPAGSGGSSAAFTVYATDREGAADTHTVNLTILSPANVAPVITSDDTVWTTEGVILQYAVVATDANSGDAITYSFDNLPSWLTAADSSVSGTAEAGGSDTAEYSFDAIATDMGGRADTLTVTVFVISNAQPVGSLLTVFGADDTLGGTIAVAYRLNDADGDSITASLEYNIGGTWYPATAAPRTGPDGTEDTLLWASGTDLKGQVFADPVRVRLTVADRYHAAAASDSTTAFYLMNMLGDYDGDMDIDLDDLLVMKNAWQNDSLEYELGPVTGTMPSLTLQADSVMDGRDINVFVLMWHWAYSKGYYTTGTFSGKPAAGVRLETLPDGGTVVSMDGIDAPAAVQLSLAYDPEAVTIRAIENTTGRNDALFLSGNDATAGHALICAASMEGCLPASDGFEPVGLDIKAGAGAEIAVSYDVRDAEGRVLARGVEVLRVGGDEVDWSGKLFRADPNPFNGATEFRFAGTETGAARLSVYDNAGRLVRSICTKSTGNGVSRVVWDGRDRNGVTVPVGAYVCKYAVSGRTFGCRITRVR